MTTLVDPKRYRKDKLAELYQLRWLATEVNFKHLKTTLQMEIIVTKTPEMVQKDIWVHLLAYNLLRTLMWQSAQQNQVSPLRISCAWDSPAVQPIQTPLRSSKDPATSLALHNSVRCDD